MNNYLKLWRGFLLITENLGEVNINLARLFVDYLKRGEAFCRLFKKEARLFVNYLRHSLNINGGSFCQKLNKDVSLFCQFLKTKAESISTW